MNRSEIAISVIARVTGVPEASLNPEMELVADLAMDSAKALELIVELEDQFAIEIDDDEAAGMNTVGDVLATITSLDTSTDQSRESV
jgi:acyl carrier protein